MLQFLSAAFILLEKKATRCQCILPSVLCGQDSTTPTANLEASVATRIGSFRSKCRKIGALINLVFNYQNAYTTLGRSSRGTNSSFLCRCPPLALFRPLSIKRFSRLAIRENPLINQRQQFANPIKMRMSLTKAGRGQLAIAQILSASISTPFRVTTNLRQPTCRLKNSHFNSLVKSRCLLSLSRTILTCFLQLSASYKYIKISSRYTITQQSSRPRRAQFIYPQNTTRALVSLNGTIVYLKQLYLVRKVVFYQSLSLIRMRQYASRISSFIKNFAGANQSRDSQTRGRAYLFLIVTALRALQSTYRRRLLSFFFIKRMPAPAREVEGRIYPFSRLSARQLRRVSSSIIERLYNRPYGASLPSSRSILSLFGPVSGRRDSFPSTKTSAKSENSLRSSGSFSASSIR